jgi:virginiamycin B lyase
LIGIIAVAAVSVSVFARPPPTGSNNEAEAMKRFEQQWCGPDAKANSNGYVSEFVLPKDCEMPSGIAVDGEQVWYVSAKRGLLGSYSPSQNSFHELAIPEWPSLKQPFTRVPSWAMSWTVRPDGNGSVWFTDENDALWRFNKASESFDKFNVPASYPSAMDFDSNGNIYFIGINSESLYFGDVSKMRAGTSEGITSIPLPLDGFAGINPSLITTGLLVVDNERNNVWVSLLAFQRKGQLFQYDIDTGKIVHTVDLPAELSSPVGGAIDAAGNLWVGDHGTNIFFKYDPASEELTKYMTSVASSRIFGRPTPQNAYTWPYWLHEAADGSIWFNQHTGNKIARFDPETLTLTEYWIPSQNRNWSVCPPEAETCGIANAMQFTVGQNGQVWFTEWTENKIARLDAAKQIPLTVSAPAEITVARGDSAEIRVTINTPGDFNGRMIASGTFTPTGMLGNSTGIFSEESVSLSGNSKEISYTFTPAETLAPGQYTIMIGAENNEVSQLKAVMINIV